MNPLGGVIYNAVVGTDCLILLVLLAVFGARLARILKTETKSMTLRKFLEKVSLCFKRMPTFLA